MYSMLIHMYQMRYMSELLVSLASQTFPLQLVKGMACDNQDLKRHYEIFIFHFFFFCGCVLGATLHLRLLELVCTWSGIVIR